MTKVITYGTYDLLHYGHIRLLERAKALGDYLIVAVTADDFDIRRGKINVQQSLTERIEAVKATGLADEIIVEEYEGQKIDDIKRYGVDIFTVGSDWEGRFDYLSEYCRVVYLPRTEGVSSTELRSEKRALRLGLAGELFGLRKVIQECRFANGILPVGVYASREGEREEFAALGLQVYEDYAALLEDSDAVFIAVHPRDRAARIREALEAGRHVMCLAPLAEKREEFSRLFSLAEEKGLVLMTAVKTAYATAYYRLLLMVKSGVIGKVVSVDATATSQSEVDISDTGALEQKWTGLEDWGTVAMLPIFQILGTDYTEARMVAAYADPGESFDVFTKIDFLYPGATASLKVGRAVKSEGELVISGTRGYIYVPAPWWKTDYFEIRYENPMENKRNFYKLEGEGIRFELVSFARAIQNGTPDFYLDRKVSGAMTGVLEDFRNRKNLHILQLDGAFGPQA